MYPLFNLFTRIQSFRTLDRHHTSPICLTSNLNIGIINKTVGGNSLYRETLLISRANELSFCSKIIANLSFSQNLNGRRTNHRMVA